MITPRSVTHSLLPFFLPCKAFLNKWSKYPVFAHYFKNTWAGSLDRVRRWASAFRQHLPTGGQDTNNIIESNNRVLKVW